MTDEMLKRIGESFPLTELDAGAYACMKANGMNYRVKSYKAEGLGHVSLMSASGMMGLMKMEVFIVNPFFRDAPLFSNDRVHAMGRETLILELYNTCLDREAFDASGLERVREAYAAYPDKDLGSHWYDPLTYPVNLAKVGKKAEKAAFDELTVKYLSAYLEAVKTAPECSEEAKKAAARVYTEGLLSNGGPSTDVFKKGIGPEKTAELFRTVLFGTE